MTVRPEDVDLPPTVQIDVPLGSIPEFMNPETYLSLAAQHRDAGEF